MKKILGCKGMISLLLCLLMILSCVPGVALAENELILTLEGATQVEIDSSQEVVLAFTPQESGYYRFYSESDFADSVGTLLDEQKNTLTMNDDGYVGNNNYDFSLKHNLEAGKTYYLVAAVYSEVSEVLDVYVSKSVGVVSAKMITPPDVTDIIKGYEYDTMSLYGLEVEFTLEDGTTEIWSADDDNVIAETKVTTYPVEENDTYSTHVVCDAALLNVKFNVIDNPVESIAYDGEGLVYYENTYGYFDDALQYYVYNYEMPWEDTVTVKYTDGTTQAFELSEVFPYLDYSHEHNQDTTPWVVGTHAITITYLGKQTTIPVQILPCPFKSVTVDSNPTTEIVYGDMQYGTLNGDVYYFTPYDLTGIRITFELKDGSTKTYTAEDFDMAYAQLDGYPFDIEIASCEKPGLAEASFSYKGMDVTFKVKIVESPLTGLEVIGIAKNLLYEDYYYPIMDGLKVKVTMKDGTSQTVELNDETLQYGMQNGFYYIVPVGDYSVTIYNEYDENDEEYYAFYCLDLYTEYHDFSFKPVREVENVVISDFAPDGDGMVLNISYTNNETDTLHVEKICEDTWGMYGEYMGKTENGIMWYAIGEEHTDDGELAGYRVTVLHYDVFVPVEDQNLGDVDGDDKISAKDALQVLRCVVGKTVFTPAQEVAADVNEDGDISAKDALEILKKVVGKPACF